MPNAPISDTCTYDEARVIARRMIDAWLRPTKDQHTATMEGLADASFTITTALMEAAEKRGVKFKYDA